MTNRIAGKISVVIPVYNEEKVLEELARRLVLSVKGRNEVFEFVFVNDGSTDGTLEALLELNKRDKRFCIIDLARNFGHQQAITAGLDFADGDAVILMDADLEDKPEDIVPLIEKWREGYDVVYAIRESRKVSFFKEALFTLFHRINSSISNVPMDASGIFGLMDRIVVDYLKKFAEYNRYIPGLRKWVGFSQIGISVQRGERYDGTPRVTTKKLFRLAFDSFTSFSDTVLSLPLYLGVALTVLSLVGVIIIIILKLFYDVGPWGWPSMVSIMFFLAGLQFFFLGLLGEFISRINIEVKKRPLYIIRKSYR